MGSSESKSSGGGNEHIGKLYFDPEADSSTGKDYFITDAELREILSQLVDETEKILDVRYYTNPLLKVPTLVADIAEVPLLKDVGGALVLFAVPGVLPPLQIARRLLRHAFIVFETDKWWWSIEKNELGVTIQRSKKIEYVREKFRREDRNVTVLSGIECGKKKKGSHTMQQLISHIYAKNYLNEDYNLVSSNCKHFANNIYEFI